VKLVSARWAALAAMRAVSACARSALAFPKDRYPHVCAQGRVPSWPSAQPPRQLPVGLPRPSRTPFVADRSNNLSSTAAITSSSLHPISRRRGVSHSSTPKARYYPFDIGSSICLEPGLPVPGVGLAAALRARRASDGQRALCRAQDSSDAALAVPKCIAAGVMKPMPYGSCDTPIGLCNRTTKVALSFGSSGNPVGDFGSF
jgi:hypothetical protein